METFETYENTQKINAKIIKQETKALRLGPVSFYLRKIDDPSDFEGLNNLTLTSSRFDKDKVKSRALLEIYTQFMVEENQLPNKETIMKSTLIKYSVFDQDNRGSYFSTYNDFEDEYHSTDDEQFTITKRIKIIFKDDLLNNYRVFTKKFNT